MTVHTFDHPAGPRLTPTTQPPPTTPAGQAVSQPGVSFTRVEHPGCTVVTAVGEVDLHTAPLMRLVLAGAASAQVVVDLSQVSLIDSGGLNVLAGAHRHARTDGGCLRLVGPTGAVRKVLAITGLDQVLPIHASVAEATRACARTGRSSGNAELGVLPDHRADAGGGTAVTTATPAVPGPRRRPTGAR